jgi:hypothetical protein
LQGLAQALEAQADGRGSRVHHAGPVETDLRSLD